MGSKLIDKPGLPYVLGYDVPDHSLVNASGVFSGYSRRRTRRNKGPFDKPAAAVQASIATLTKGGMGTVRILFPFSTRSTNTQRPSRCWMCLDSSAASSLRRKAQPKSNAQNRAVPFRFGVFELGLSKQVARLFPDTARIKRWGWSRKEVERWFRRLPKSQTPRHSLRRADLAPVCQTVQARRGVRSWGGEAAPIFEPVICR